MTNILPRAGGTLDQDPEFMRDLRVISSIEADYQKIGHARAAMKKQMAGGKK